MSPSTTTADAHQAAKHQLAAEVLRSSRKLRLQATGWSMLPTIFPGDTLMIERADCTDIAEGDIVLCTREKRFAIHRVVDKNADTVLTRGDAMPRNDPQVAPRDLLGKVILITRSGQKIEPRKKMGIPGRAVAAMIRRSHFAARVLLKLHQLQQRSRNLNSHDQVVTCQS